MHTSTVFYGHIYENYFLLILATAIQAIGYTIKHPFKLIREFVIAKKQKIQHHINQLWKKKYNSLILHPHVENTLAPFTGCLVEDEDLDDDTQPAVRFAVNLYGLGGI
ncbi:hypothetical protein ACJX0J_023018 [Zea mays]